jgi:hypothetical protein
MLGHLEPSLTHTLVGSQPMLILVYHSGSHNDKIHLFVCCGTVRHILYGYWNILFVRLYVTFCMVTGIYCLLGSTSHFVWLLESIVC